MVHTQVQGHFDRNLYPKRIYVLQYSKIMQNHVTDSDRIIFWLAIMIKCYPCSIWRERKKEQRIQNLRFCCFDIKNNHDELQKDDAYVINAS